MDRDQYDRKILTAFAVTGVFLLALTMLTFSLDEISRDRMVKEGGWVESMSAFGYFLCALFFAFKGKLTYLRQYHYFFLLFIFFMLRELDFHKRFTTMGILKSRFYISDSVPFIEKLFGALVLGLLLYVVFIILYRHFEDFRFELKRRSLMSVGVLIIMVLIFISKSLDGIGRKFKDLGLHISDAAIANTAAIEEILELGIPIIIFIVLHASFRKINAH